VQQDNKSLALASHQVHFRSDVHSSTGRRELPTGVASHKGQDELFVLFGDGELGELVFTWPYLVVRCCHLVEIKVLCQRA
jgi:hypothetical protein